MFSTIVVGTDGSANAEAAVRAAAELVAVVPDATIHVVTASGEEALTGARSILESSDIDDARYHELEGHPVDALLQAVERYGADLLVVGSRGEGRARRALHGSVSTNALHHATCSVMIVHSSSTAVVP